MTTRTREPAIRVRLSPSTDAFVGRRGAHFVRGREIFWLDEREIRRLVEIWQEIETSSLDEVMSAILSGSPVVPSPEP